MYAHIPLAVVLLLQCQGLVQGAPRRRKDMDPVGYLYNYGYLPKSDMVKGVKRSQREVKMATMMLQKFMSMPMTGTFDDDTMDMMDKPRCGVADMNMKNEHFKDDGVLEGVPSRLMWSNRPEEMPMVEEFSLFPGAPRWDKYHLTYSFTNFSPQLDEADIRDACVGAFKLWSDATLLSFSEAPRGSTEEADIKIEFSRYYHGDAYPHDEAGPQLAHAFAPGPGILGDVHFDDYERWTVKSYDGVNLFFVAVHEIGHALGLGHSGVLGSIMYPSYGGYRPDLELHSDDRVIIQYLYGVNEGKPDKVPTTSTTTTTTTTTTPAPPKPESPGTAPDVCQTGIDAVVLAHMGKYEESEIFMFKGEWFWRRSFTSMMEIDRIQNKWPGLPHDLTHVDAVYQNPSNNRLVFFSGDRYWEFHYTHRDRHTPRHGRSLTDLGLPSDIKKVDAVFTWGYNQRTYIVAGNMYWKLDDVTGRVEEESYPRDMNLWEGVPTPVDAAFQLWDGRTYFFKDQDFFVFDDDNMRVGQTNKDQVGRYWLWCS